MKKTCNSCAWFVKNTGYNAGDCRFKAPILHPCVVMDGMYNDRHKEAHWPRVGFEAYCHDHEERNFEMEFDEAAKCLAGVKCGNCETLEDVRMPIHHWSYCRKCYISREKRELKIF